MRPWTSAWWGILALAVCLRAGADEADDSAAAQSLYDYARRLMKAGDYAGACPKLEASQKLDPGTGTQFHLADCYEHIGRTASAWALFLDVAAQARQRQRGEQEQIARTRAAALELKLSKLTIVVPDASRVAGLVVKRDGTEVESALFGAAINVDPGKHAITAEAPRHELFQGEVTVAPDGAHATLEIPALELVAVDPRTPSAPSRDLPQQQRRSGKGLRTISYVALGVGVVGLGVGSFFTLRSASKRGDADDLFEACGGGQCQNGDPRSGRISELDDAARSAKKSATIGFIVGGAGVATGVTLLVLSRPSDQTQGSKPRVTPWIGLGHAGLSGHF
jgi:hypothetical protein